MKRAVLLVLALAVLLLNAQGVFVIHNVTDPRGDFRGPGWYTPAQNTVFKNGTVFDLVRFEVLYNATTDRLIFRFTFADLGGNPWNSQTGFSMQYIQLYISRGFPGNPWGTVSCTILRPDDGNVATGNAFFDEGTRFFCPDTANLTQLRFTPAVRFSGDAPWDVAIFVGPKFGNETVNYIAVADVTSGSISVTPLTRVYAVGNTVVAEVPRSLLRAPPAPDFPQPSWAYYVLVTSYDGFGPGRIRPFGPLAQEWTVGVGTRNASAVLAGTVPRVLDMLGPNTPLAGFSNSAPATLTPTTPRWGNFPLAYTTATVTRIVPLTSVTTTTLPITTTQVVTATQFQTVTSVQYQVVTNTVVQVAPTVDPISYVVLGVGVVAGLVGAFAAARRR